MCSFNLQFLTRLAIFKAKIKMSAGFSFDGFCSDEAVCPPGSANRFSVSHLQTGLPTRPERTIMTLKKLSLKLAEAQAKARLSG